MKKTRKAARILAFILALALLAFAPGCGEPGPSSQTPSGTPGQSPSRISSASPAADSEGNGFTTGITLNSEGSITVFAFAEGQNYEKVLRRFEEITGGSLKTKLQFQWAANIKTEQPLRLAEQGDIDLIFDGGWLNAASNISQGLYKDISAYFNNPDYPGLQKAFPPILAEAMKNPSDGKIYGIPFNNSYNNLKTITLRGDWREKLGCEPVTDDATLEAYLKAVDEHKSELGAVSAMGLGDRGWYYFQEQTYENQRKNIFEVASTGARITQNAYVLLNDEMNRVLDVMYIGDPSEEHPLFPDGNFLNSKTIALAQRWNRYINEDALSISGQDVRGKFEAGLYGAIEIELGAFMELKNSLSAYAPGARLEFYLYDSQLANREKVYMEKDLSNNYLFVPYFNENPDRAMAVLDWVFESQANNDLFTLGIEGEDWEAVGERQYRLLNPSNKYVFPSWLFSINPFYTRQDADVPSYIMEYYAYSIDPGNFISHPFAGFSFDTNPVMMEYTAFTTAQQDYYPLFMNGGYGPDTKAKLEEFHSKTRAYKDVIREELKKQLNDYFRNK